MPWVVLLGGINDNRMDGTGRSQRDAYMSGLELPWTVNLSNMGYD